MPFFVVNESFPTDDRWEMYLKTDSEMKYQNNFNFQAFIRVFGAGVRDTLQHRAEDKRNVAEEETPVSL